MVFDDRIARRYRTLWPELFDPALIEATVDVLADLAGAGPALEFAVGTGRIAVPLSRRGIEVHGIELSPAMAAHVAGVPVSIGDMTTVSAGSGFALVYLLRNTITNLTTEAAQAAAFRNAAAHLAPGGSFLIEKYVPSPSRRRVFVETPTHLGWEEYDEAARIAVSHHRWTLDGETVTFSSPHRYVWPAELDAMAAAAGLSLRERWSNWQREPFTSSSDSHVSVWSRAT